MLAHLAHQHLIFLSVHNWYIAGHIKYRQEKHVHYLLTLDDRKGRISSVLRLLNGHFAFVNLGLRTRVVDSIFRGNSAIQSFFRRLCLSKRSNFKKPRCNYDILRKAKMWRTANLFNCMNTRFVVCRIVGHEGSVRHVGTVVGVVGFVRELIFVFSCWYVNSSCVCV